MTLLAPWALWLSAIGAAVVALYVLKIKRRREIVPALDFWRQLAGPAPVRSLFERLKRWWSMFLWLVIVACLLLAIGNPVLSWGRVKPRAIAIVLDNSASMQVVEDEQQGISRLELARRAVEEMTTRRPVNDEWLLIEAGAQPVVRQAWTRNRRAVRKAVAAIEPFAGAADLAAARELADQLLAGKQRPTTVILSDGGAGQVAPPSEGDEATVYWPIGRRDDNVGIVRLRVRPDRQQLAHQAYVRVVNDSNDDVDTQLIFEQDGSVTAVEPISVAAGGQWERTVRLDAPQGGVLSVRLDHSDALTLDNEAFAILPPIEPAKVVLVTPAAEAYFFEQALAAMAPLVAPELGRTFSIEEYERLEPPADPPDLVIFNNVAPRHLPPGQFIFVNDWPEEIPARIVGTLEAPQLTIALRHHPLTRYVNLRPVTVAHAHQVDLFGRATVLARSAEGAPLIFLYEQPDRLALCLAFDVLESDLPFRNAFPLFLRNAVALLATDETAWVRDQYEIGALIEPLRPLPSDVTAVSVARLRGDEVEEQPVKVQQRSFVFRDTDRAGPLRFDLSGRFAYTAVNLTNEGESRVRPAAGAGDPAERLALSDQLLGSVPWLVLASVAALLICLEWLTYHFRWTE